MYTHYSNEIKKRAAPLFYKGYGAFFPLLYSRNSNSFDTGISNTLAILKITSSDTELSLFSILDIGEGSQCHNGVAALVTFSNNFDNVTGM
jgi:hypothetical protein